jgi:tRNA uridine 5-carbamoylmethylation protein Kti12
MAQQDSEPPLRFHLMIGAACSGKSTAARILARYLQGESQQQVRYI